jgi:hypothetical protein
LILPDLQQVTFKKVSSGVWILGFEEVGVCWLVKKEESLPFGEILEAAEEEEEGRVLITISFFGESCEVSFWAFYNSHKILGSLGPY